MPNICHAYEQFTQDEAYLDSQVPRVQIPLKPI